MSDTPRKPPRLSSDPESASPPEPPETPPREFRLKPTEFERANRPADAFGDNAAIDTRQLYREANAKSPPVAAPAKAGNEVHAILRDNLARANARGLNQVVPRKRRSRRKRDYWLMLVGGNLLVVGVVLALHPNVVTLIFGLSAVVLLSLGLTWVMWAVMDDY